MTEIDWQRIRDAYETAHYPITTLARDYGVSRAALSRRALAEGWLAPKKKNRSTARIEREDGGRADPAPPRLAPPPDPPSPLDGGLSPRQRLFVAEYLVDLDEAAAMRRIGIPLVTATLEGRSWLEDPKIQAAIEAGLAARVARVGVTADRVLQELARIGFAVITDFVSWTDDQVAIRDSALLTRDQAAAITELTRTRDGVRVKFDKLPALNALARYLGLPGAGQVAVGSERDDALVIRPDEPIPENPVL